MSRGEARPPKLEERRRALIAVGTTRIPKIRALTRVLSQIRHRCPEFFPEGVRLEARSVSSGVPETPKTIEEAMMGAEKRAQSALAALHAEGFRPALAVGLEGGVCRIQGSCLLESWAYVTDGERGFFGGSGSIPLPDALAESVMARGESLGIAADRLFDRTEVAAQEGTFGVLTRMMVSREEAFARSLLHALAPFYNASVYLGLTEGEPEG